MSMVVETLLVAAARELVLTRAVLLWYGVGVYEAAAAVAFGPWTQLSGVATGAPAPKEK